MKPSKPNIYLVRAAQWPVGLGKVGLSGNIELAFNQPDGVGGDER
jgi:hypothetical protein